MAVTAYILIQTEVAKAAAVATQVRQIPGVVAADDVTGPYDVVVRVEACADGVRCRPAEGAIARG